MFEQIPEGLSDKPTLSLKTEVPKAGRYKVRLSYLATGFNWSADYVAKPRPDGKTLDLEGWNIRAAGLSPGALAHLSGSTIPFAKTKAERDATGDPRTSVEERYPSPQDHARAMTAAARRLVGEGFLLEEDYERMPRTGDWH